jgi:hypothetical protein
MHIDLRPIRLHVLVWGCCILGHTRIIHAIGRGGIAAKWCVGGRATTRDQHERDQRHEEHTRHAANHITPRVIREDRSQRIFLVDA